AIESSPGRPGAVEVTLAGFAEGPIEGGDETRGQALFLRGLAQIRGEGIDVPVEDAHLSPVVHLALAEESVDPFPEPVEGSVDEARGPFDPLPGPSDRVEQFRSLRLERFGVRRLGRGHRQTLIAGRLFSLHRTIRERGPGPSPGPRARKALSGGNLPAKTHATEAPRETERFRPDRDLECVRHGKLD